MKTKLEQNSNNHYHDRQKEINVRSVRYNYELRRCLLLFLETLFIFIVEIMLRNKQKNIIGSFS